MSACFCLVETSFFQAALQFTVTVIFYFRASQTSLRYLLLMAGRGLTSNWPYVRLKCCLSVTVTFLASPSEAWAAWLFFWPGTDGDLCYSTSAELWWHLGSLHPCLSFALIVLWAAADAQSLRLPPLSFLPALVPELWRHLWLSRDKVQSDVAGLETPPTCDPGARLACSFSREQHQCLGVVINAHGLLPPLFAIRHSWVFNPPCKVIAVPPPCSACKDGNAIRLLWWGYSSAYSIGEWSLLPVFKKAVLRKLPSLWNAQAGVFSCSLFSMIACK